MLRNVFDIDSAKYAKTRMGMQKNGNYLIITNRGKDNLDKPPFLFWVNSLPFKILTNSLTFGYGYGGATSQT